MFWPYFAGIASFVIAIFTTWKPFVAAGRADRLRVLGPPAYAIPLIIFGADHLSSAQEVARIVPSWMPGKMFWTIFVGVALILAGLSILTNIQRRLATFLSGVMFTLFVVLMHIPGLIQLTLTGRLVAQRALWGVAGRDIAFGCAAFVLAVASDRGSLREAVERWAGRCMAAIALIFGFIHFWYPRFAPGVPLIKPNPDWMPGGAAWGYVTGIVLILGAIGMFGRDATRRSAATALGGALMLLVAIFYVPVMLAGPTVETLNYVADTLLFAASILIDAGPPGAVATVPAASLAMANRPT